MYSTNHNEILNTTRQYNCRDVCKFSLRSSEHILNYSTPNFDRISNSIEIPLVGRGAGGGPSVVIALIPLPGTRWKLGKSLKMAVPCTHDDVIKWKHFPRYWPFVRGIHWSPVNWPPKRQWRGALMFSLICAWINSWANHRDAGDLRRRRTHHDVTVMYRKRPLPCRC